VVGAADLAAFHPAPGQRGSPVHTQVGEAADATVETGEDELLVEEEDLLRLVGELGAVQHRVPEVPHRPVQAGLPGAVQRIDQELFVELVMVGMHGTRPLWPHVGR
jgi:hypothetical protein